MSGQGRDPEPGMLDGPLLTLFTAPNIHKSSPGCIHVLSAPARGAQEQPGELAAGLPALESHGCPSPSMQLTPPQQNPRFEAAFHQVHSQSRGRKQLFNRQGSEASPECTKSKADYRKPPWQVLQKTFVLERHNRASSSALCCHHPRRASIYPPPTGVLPRGIPHLPFPNLPVPAW